MRATCALPGGGAAVVIDKGGGQRSACGAVVIGGTFILNGVISLSVRGLECTFGKLGYAIVVGSRVVVLGAPT